MILHELGHALVARRNGLSVAGIDLWAFGGLTRMRELPSTPGVAAARGGRRAAGDAGGDHRLRARRGPGGASGGHFADVATGNSRSARHAGARVAELGRDVNALVLVFNLIPAFPLDGGQIAQPLIWWRTGDRNRATRWTGRAGQGSRSLLGALGLVGLARGDSIGAVHAGARASSSTRRPARRSCRARSASASRA